MLNSEENNKTEDSINTLSTIQTIVGLKEVIDLTTRTIKKAVKNIINNKHSHDQVNNKRILESLIGGKGNIIYSLSQLSIASNRLVALEEKLIARKKYEVTENEEKSNWEDMSKVDMEIMYEDLGQKLGYLPIWRQLEVIKEDKLKFEEFNKENNEENNIN